MTLELSPAAHAYVGGYYKRYTDKGMNTQEIRRGLSDNGILRTMQQVREDLTRYGYPNYAATHEGPRPPTLREMALEDEAKLKKTRQVAAQRPKSYEAGLHGIAGAIRRRQQEAGSAA